jgi:hypothetical protein
VISVNTLYTTVPNCRTRMTAQHPHAPLSEPYTAAPPHGLFVNRVGNISRFPTSFDKSNSMVVAADTTIPVQQIMPVSTAVHFTKEQLKNVQQMLGEVGLLPNDIPVTAVVLSLMAQIMLPIWSAPKVTLEPTHITARIDMTNFPNPTPETHGTPITTVSGDCIRRIAALNAFTQFEPITNVQLEIAGEFCTLVVFLKKTQDCYWLPTLASPDTNLLQASSDLPPNETVNSNYARPKNPKPKPFNLRRQRCATEPPADGFPLKNTSCVRSLKRRRDDSELDDETDFSADDDHDSSYTPNPMDIGAVVSHRPRQRAPTETERRRNVIAALIHDPVPVNLDVLGFSEEDIQTGRIKMPKWAEENDDNLHNIKALFQKRLRTKVQVEDLPSVMLVAAHMFHILRIPVPEPVAEPTESEMTFDYPGDGGPVVERWSNTPRRLTIAQDDKTTGYALRLSDVSFNLSYADLREMYLASRIGKLAISDVRVEKARVGAILRWFLVVRVERLQFHIEKPITCLEEAVANSHTSGLLNFFECHTCMRVPGSRQVGAAPNYIVTPRKILHGDYAKMMTITSFADATCYQPNMELAGTLVSSVDPETNMTRQRNPRQPASKRARVTYQKPASREHDASI